MSRRSFVFELTLMAGLSCTSSASAQLGDHGMQAAERPAKNENGPTHRSATISWDSPRLRKIDQKLAAMGFSEVDARDRAELEQRALVAILRQELSRDELHELATSFATLPVHPDHSDEFQSKLVLATINRLLESGDRSGLGLVLSLRCPTWVGPVEIERYLTLFSEKFRDPITVLGEAHAKSKIPEARNAIAAACRRAFTASGVQGKDDQEFVRNAMR